jgi:HD-GYP domain-containing protein (c-di-GMP phosphodiesterase class II)
VAEDTQPTISDIVSANQLQRVVDDAVAQANIGMAVVAPDGRILSESYGDADPCPQVREAAIDSMRCPHGSGELAWLAAAQGGVVEDHCPRGACRRAYPLRYRDYVWGALITCSHDGAPQAVVDAVAALTVERLRDLIVAGFELQSLSREIVANYEQLTLLYGASIEVGAAHDATSICQRVLEQLDSQMPSEAMAVMLLSEETGHARVAAARGELSDAFQQPMPDMPDGVLCHVLATGEHAVVCDVPQRGCSDTSSILCVPLMAGDRLMGAICARDKLSGVEYLAGDAKVAGAVAAQAAIAISNAVLFGDVKNLFVGTVRSLASAVDAKDPYTLGHSQRVTQYAMVIARELGLSNDEVEDLQLAALLHDVGKIGLPDEILLKAGKLTSEEWEQVRKHPIWGEEILRPIKQLRRVASWIRHEHERWNGSGYPDGLRSGAIPVPSRIIAVADAFDALTSDRSYRKAVSVTEAISILESAAGTEYDPEVVAAFLTAVESGKIDK